MMLMYKQGTRYFTKNHHISDTKNLYSGYFHIEAVLDFVVDCKF